VLPRSEKPEVEGPCGVLEHRGRGGEPGELGLPSEDDQKRLNRHRQKGGRGETKKLPIEQDGTDRPVKGGWPRVRGLQGGKTLENGFAMPESTKNGSTNGGAGKGWLPVSEN